MRVKRLFAFVLAAAMIAMLFCGCGGAYTTESIAYVAGTVPEGYMETFTSLEDCCD